MAMKKITKKCPSCDGSGRVNLNGRPDTTCPTCQGGGTVEEWVAND